MNYLRSILPEAEVFNFENPLKLDQLNSFLNMPILNSKSVSYILNKSKVGVILSHKEGACYASIEYLLSGLPVVTTRNIGGRNVFLDKRFCKFVFSNSISVERAVSKLLKQNIPSDFIRTITLEKMQIHIDKIKTLLENIFKENGNTNISIDKKWKKFYINKMLKIGEKFPENFIKDIA